MYYIARTKKNYKCDFFRKQASSTIIVHILMFLWVMSEADRRQPAVYSSVLVV